MIQKMQNEKLNKFEWYNFSILFIYILFLWMETLNISHQAIKSFEMTDFRSVPER